MNRVRSLNKALIAGIFTTMLCGPAMAASYPDKPIRVLVPYAPGGATDILARKIGRASWSGKSVSVRVDLGGSRIIKKKNKHDNNIYKKQKCTTAQNTADENET